MCGFFLVCVSVRKRERERESARAREREREYERERERERERVRERREKERESAQRGEGGSSDKEGPSSESLSFLSLCAPKKKETDFLLHSQGTLTMTKAQRKHSPTSSAAATRHSASESVGSQSRAAIVARSDESICILVFFACAVALDRAASGFAPPARERRVVAAI